MDGNHQRSMASRAGRGSKSRPDGMGVPDTEVGTQTARPAKPSGTQKARSTPQRGSDGQWPFATSLPSQELQGRQDAKKREWGSETGWRDLRAGWAPTGIEMEAGKE